MKIYFFATSEIEYKVNVNPYNDVEMIHDFWEIMKWSHLPWLKEFFSIYVKFEAFMNEKYFTC